MKIKTNKYFGLYAPIVVILITLIFLPNPASSEETYVFERMWPTLQQPWYFSLPSGIAIDKNGFVYVAEHWWNHRTPHPEAYLRGRVRDQMGQ